MSYYLDYIENIIEQVNHTIWGIPIIAYIIGIGLLASIVFNFAQIRYFFTGWKLIFKMKSSEGESEKGTITPIQAFINALSASLGNGGLAGMAVVLVDGGPGTAFWVFILGFVSMMLRFLEVYGGIKLAKNGLVGPLGYISSLPFGNFFVYIYAFILLVYILFGGIAMQTNSIGFSLQKAFSLDPVTIGIGFACLLLYIILGGSERIMKASEYIIPVKVIAFFLGIIALLFYHRANIVSSLKLIIDSAFTLQSIGKGLVLYTMQRAITVGFSRALNATEAGIGTASIFFSSTESKEPLKTAIMSMITAFISTNLVCAMLIFAIVTSGVSLTEFTSTQLVIAAFETVLGSFAGPAITFLSFSFGIGVMVAYTFLGYKTWDFLFGKKTMFLYYILLVLLAFLGSIASVAIIWKSLDILVGILIFINLLGLLWNMRLLKGYFVAESKNLEI